MLVAQGIYNAVRECFFCFVFVVVFFLFPLSPLPLHLSLPCLCDVLHHSTRLSCPNNQTHLGLVQHVIPRACALRMPPVPPVRTYVA